MDMIYVVIAAIIIIAAIFLKKRNKQDGREELDMPQGLQVFDANGNLVLNYTDETGYIFGMQEITGGVSGSLQDARVVAGKTFIFPTYAEVEYSELMDKISGLSGGARDMATFYAHRYAVLPRITISNGSISWDFPPLSDSRGCHMHVVFAYGGYLV